MSVLARSHSLAPVASFRSPAIQQHSFTKLPVLPYAVPRVCFQFTIYGWIHYLFACSQNEKRSGTGRTV
jgi:hypothetical protein